jgi:hypothetical protein
MEETIGRKDLEELWRGRLADAKASYEIAVTQFRTASEDFRAHCTPSPDGGLSVHLAIVAESRARKEYMRVLRVFTDLLVYGKAPGDADAHEKPATSVQSAHFPRKTA